MSQGVDPSLHFTVLGSVDLQRTDGSRLLSLLAQPKRVALLTYVAVEAPGGFMPRERIMSVLWPDSDNTRARQSLRNSLYQIRQAAGAEVLTNRGSVDVGVDPALLIVDAVALKTAVSQGRFQEAADLYGGPFLSGFHLDDAPEFEEWSERTRASLEADALRAFREAAWARERSGDIEAARVLLRRAQELVPTDEEILRRRLLLLARQGNRAAAVAEAEEWIEMLRSTLDIDPSGPTLRLVHDLRSGGQVGGASPVGPTSPPEPSPPREQPLSPATTAPAPVGEARPRRRRAPLVWALGTAALALLAWILVTRSPAEPPVEGGVIVVPLQADSAAGGPTVGWALGYLIARYLQPETGGLVLPPEGVTAASFDGRNRRLIRGEIRAVDGRLVADVGLATTAQPGRVSARATASADDGDLEAIARRLADGLASRSGGNLSAPGPVPRFTRAPGAILPFFQGEMFAREGKAREASEAYRRALALDSTFAMAYYRLSVTEALEGESAEARKASDRAVDLSAGLSDSERALLNAWQAYRGGGVLQALPRYEALAALRGPDPDVWLRLAELRFHWGPQLGIPKDSTAAAFRVLLRLVPNNANALQHLIRLMGPSAKPEELNQAVRRLDRGQASHDMRMEARAIAALNRRTLPDDSVVEWLTGGTHSVEARRLEQLAASARVPYDLAPFIRALPPTEDPYRRIPRRLLLAQLAASAGRMGEAYGELDTVSALNRYRGAEYRSFLALSSPVPPPADTLRAIRRELRSFPLRPFGALGLYSLTRAAIDGPRAVVLDAMLTRRLGEPVDTSGLMAKGSAASHEFSPVFVKYLRADGAWVAGQPAGVLANLGPGRPESNGYGDPLSYLVGTSKWERIRSLVALGRDEDALRWLGTIPDYGGYDLVYVAPAALLRARILERLGHTAQAATAYQKAAEVWADADPAFDSLVASARRGAERNGATGGL
ncbi:MAG: hypothetical protein LJF04_14755 [Gemmatimonadetes bacterium]|nr:hypothetical protein [Gemmatimonadota bacterium]